MSGWMIAGRNINNLKYADNTTLMTEREEKLMSLLVKVKEESEKASLKLNILKINIMLFSPTCSWQIDGETMETVTTLLSWAPKSLQMLTATMKIKKCLLLERKVMTNLDNMLKSRDITLPTKIHMVKVMVFPVVMFGYESFTIKKAEH